MYPRNILFQKLASHYSALASEPKFAPMFPSSLSFLVLTKPYEYFCYLQKGINERTNIHLQKKNRIFIALIG